MKGFEDTLLHHPFFKDLKHDYLKLIADCGEHKVFKPGDMIGHEGDNADYFFIVRNGKIAIQIFSPSEGAITLQTIGQNEIVGWSWLFPP